MKRKRRVPSKAELALRNPVANANGMHAVHISMSELSIRLLMSADGEDGTELLAPLAFHLSLGTLVALHVQGPASPLLRRLHAALRDVHALCMDGYSWRADRAPDFDAALHEAKRLMLAHPNPAIALMEGAEWLMDRVARHAIEAGDVAGADAFDRVDAGETKHD